MELATETYDSYRDKLMVTVAGRIPEATSRWPTTYLMRFHNIAKKKFKYITVISDATEAFSYLLLPLDIILGL